jgi:hypothetical protein
LVQQLAPDVVAAVPKRITKLRRVSEGLLNDQWIRDIQGSLSIRALAHYVVPWSKLQGFQLHQDLEDKFIWKWSPNQQYSASSTYRAFFYGQCALPGKVTKQDRHPSSLQVFHLVGFARAMLELRQASVAQLAAQWPLCILQSV